MSMKTTNKEPKRATYIKEEFGRRFREARDGKHISRAALALRLGISPKTIQSWEMGRTWIEDLDLVRAVNVELDISVFEMMERILMPEKAKKAMPAGTRAAEPAVAYGVTRPRPGPLPPAFSVLKDSPASVSEAELLASYVALPLVTPVGVLKPVPSLTPKDVVQQVLIPGSWCPRGGALVACRMGDSGMMPMIPLGATVVIDRRSGQAEKRIGRVVAIHFAGKGLRIRHLMKEGDRLVGATTADNQRGKMTFRPERGDEIVGRVIGVLAEVF